MSWICVERGRLTMRRLSLVIVIWVGISHQVLAAEKTVRITNGEWAPYYGENLPGHGLSSRVVTEAFGLVGVEVEYVFMPWARSLMMAREGHYDAAIGWHDTAENRKDFFTSDAIASTTFVLFHLENNPFEWTTFDDLRKLKLALTRGYDYPAGFMKLVDEKQIDVAWVNNDYLGFKLLLRGRIDAFPQDRVVGYTLLNERFQPEQTRGVTHHQRHMVTTDLHLQFSRKVDRSARLLVLFNEGLSRLKESGQYDEIYGPAEGAGSDPVVIEEPPALQ